MNPGDRRFACTQCGKCCDRSPEVELGEAAALADQFVFRLLFRLYRWPRNVADYTHAGVPRAQANAEFFETKRLLGAFAAHTYNAKLRSNGKVSEQLCYLTVSALTLDSGTSACSALNEARCSIYERRPLACRSVPLHYSRGPAFAQQELDAFLATPGYACASGPAAPLLLADGRIADPALLAARSAALAQAAADQPWKTAIVKAMKAGDPNLPSLRDVEANAQRGAMTTSMRAGWQIACAAGLLDGSELRALIGAQMAVIERQLAQPVLAPAARQTLTEMRGEYALALRNYEGGMRCGAQQT